MGPSGLSLFGVSLQHTHEDRLGQECSGFGVIDNALRPRVGCCRPPFAVFLGGGNS